MGSLAAVITIACLLWDANQHSHSFSTAYNEGYVEKLYRGVKRNTTRPFVFLLFTDRKRQFSESGVRQIPLEAKEPGYSACIEPYKLNTPMILMGLDTIITGNIDGMVDYCLSGDVIALPKDPYDHGKPCNGVALVPQGHQDVFLKHNGENDMEWMRRQPHVLIDDLFPGQVVSYTAHARTMGLGDARIVYFHGHAKPHNTLGVPWIERHWS